MACSGPGHKSHTLQVAHVTLQLYVAFANELSHTVTDVSVEPPKFPLTIVQHELYSLSIAAHVDAVLDHMRALLSAVVEWRHNLRLDCPIVCFLHWHSPHHDVEEDLTPT
jgi:hypothetical protein